MPIMAKSNDEYTEVKAIKTPNGTEIDYVLSKVDNTYKRTYTAIRELEDTPPLNFKTIKPQANLLDYRIYGQTVDGKSVGDRTGNLFDVSTITLGCYINNVGQIIQNDSIDTSDFIKVSPDTNYTYKGAVIYNANTIRIAYYDQSKNFISRHFTQGNAANGETVTTPSNCEYVKLSYDNAITNLMLNPGSTPLPYEPYGYKVPVTVSNGTDTLTTPIYLPEQIRKVGDEAEYIDYGEQKQHRVRKNLLPNTATSQTTTGFTVTVNNDRSITCNGTPTNTVTLYVSLEIALQEGTYILTGCPQGGQVSEKFKLDTCTADDHWYRDLGDGIDFNITIYNLKFVRIVIYSGYTCDNLTFYPMIRKADIEDDTYEPYIENTDLDVTLPALPTVAGTNVLSVGTEVQPSDMYAKGNFKMAEGGVSSGD